MIKFLKFAFPIYLIFLFLTGITFYSAVKYEKTEDKEEITITVPGETNEVSSFISIDNGFELSGSFNTVSVYVSKLTKLQAFLLGKNNEEDNDDPAIEFEEENPKFNLTKEEETLSGKIQKDQSIEAAIIVSYSAAKELDKTDTIKFEYNFLGFIVYTYMINQKTIKIGDLIVGIKKDGVDYSINNPNELVDALNNMALGDTIIYLRNGNYYEYLIDEELSYDNANNFYCYAKYEILETYPKCDIHSINTQGPSGGFMQALSTYCTITENDLTGGKKIAGTGTISVNGNIGPIGGIKQKIITAIRNKCDIFLCPEYHYEEALEAYNQTLGHERMLLIKIPNSSVSNPDCGLIQAIKILEELK